MIQTVARLPDLYEADETAWLETMANLIGRDKHEELDYFHLQEYLSDMARRDRREVKSRLVVLLVHFLKWTHQKRKRSGSWRATIIVQAGDLEDDLSSRTLRNHAEEVLAAAYTKAVRAAAAETKLPPSTFPRQCPWTVDDLLSESTLDE